MPTVAMFAPMRPELTPLKKKIPLERVADDGSAFTHRGTVGDVDVVAVITGIGMEPARDTTQRLLDEVSADHVMVVGIAGGMGPSVSVGDLVVPEVVHVELGGPSYRATPLGDVTLRGTIISSNQFGYTPDQNAAMIADGVVGVDMETGAIAEVCDQRGVPWTAFRGISDRADDDTVDIDVLKLAGPDGGGNFKALAWYLLRKPSKIKHLKNLAKGTNLATDSAAEAAIRACADVPHSHPTST